MSTPFFKARWNQEVGVVRPSRLLSVDECQEYLKRRDCTAYVKYVTINGHVCFGQVLQYYDANGELEVALFVKGQNSMGNSYVFGLWYLPAMGDFDTIELKSCEPVEDVDHFLPCPPEYLDAISSQVDKQSPPEGW